MRPLEALVILIGLVALVLPQRVKRQAGYRWVGLALIGLGITLHLLLEGYRWQMLPAYGVIGAIVVHLVFGLFRPLSSGPASKPLSLALRLLGVLGLASSGILAVLLPVPQLPPVTGPYSVGTRTFHLVDNARPETYTPDPADVRETMVQVWYPAETVAGLSPAWLIPDAELIGPALTRWMGLPSFLMNHFNLAQTHAFQDAEIAQAGTQFPVLIFSHGWTGFRTQNTFQVEELASHGYVVFAIDHAYGAVMTVFPDGRTAPQNPEALPSGVPQAEYDLAANRLVKTWAGDIDYLLDQLADPGSGIFPADLTGGLDLDQVGVFGHSTGGGTAVEFCWTDPRCRAGLAMDAWLIPVSSQAIEDRLSQPFLFMRSENWDTLRSLTRNEARQRKVFDNLEQAGYLLYIQGTKHFDFSDLPLYSPIAPQLGLKGPLDGRQVTRIINAYSLAFFNHHLKGLPEEILADPSPRFPEVQIEVHAPK